MSKFVPCDQCGGTTRMNNDYCRECSRLLCDYCMENVSCQGCKEL